jgi:hypothetical protein
MKVSPRIALLLSLLDEAYSKRSWHGPVLKYALRGVSARVAAWRPGPELNSIRDLVWHCAYWKHVAREILIAEARRHKLAGKGAAFRPAKVFPRQPANFPKRDATLNDSQWRADLKLLESEHRKLRATMAALPDALLDKSGAKGGIKVSELAHGVAATTFTTAGRSAT